MKHFTDEQLEASSDHARARELNSLRDMLLHLKEIDRRKLFSKRGYPSIYEYGMARYKYSYDEIHRRVCAMKLIRDMPEIESKIADGSLQLTHLTQAQSYFRKVAHTKIEKLEILTKLENATKAQTKKILYNQEIKARYSFEADGHLEETVERLKGLHPHLTFDQLAKKVFEIALAQVDPTAKAVRVKAKENARELKKVQESASGDMSRAGATNLRRASAKVSRYITASIKREVWLKAQGKCQCCNSTFALEYDHIVPFAKGGSNTKENLRLLCRSCNQRKAIEAYGANKMKQYFIKSAQ